MVLPSPTSSAIRSRPVEELNSFRTGENWYGRKMVLLDAYE